MMIRALPAALVATSLLCFTSLQAQSSRDFCDELFTELEVGEYAEWEFRMVGQPEMSVSMAVVDKETVDGEELYWLEMTMPLPAGGITISAQMLVPGFPFDSGEMRDYVIKYGDELPLRVPAADMGSLPGDGWNEECRNTESEYVGIKQVTLEGVGTFDAHHVRTVGEEPSSWYFSPRVPFAMLKFDSAEGIMRVVKIGSDYKSRIDRSAIQ